MLDAENSVLLVDICSCVKRGRKIPCSHLLSYRFGGADISVLLAMVQNGFLGEKRCCQVSIWYCEFFAGWYSGPTCIYIQKKFVICTFQDEKRSVVEYYLCTVNRKVFAGKIFCQLNFCVVLFLLLLPLDKIKLVYLFVENKYFAGLIFVIEGVLWKIFQDENYPIYGTLFNWSKGP